MTANKYKMETWVGSFVLAGLLCVAYISVNLGEMSIPGASGSYILKARFNSVQGLNTGSVVSMAGVKIGKVETITLDTEDFVAIIEISLPNNIEINDDAIASIKTNGMIGDRYLDLTPGGSGIVLEPGETITETESAIDIESLIKKFAFGDVEKE